MKRFLILIFFLIFITSLSAQEKGSGNRGIIKVQKKEQLAKIQFDNINYRLVGIDQYGNVLDSAVMEFQMSANINGIFYSEKTAGPDLSTEMQQLLGKCTQTTKIFFQKIKAKDRNGTIINMPDFQYAYGNFEENND